MGNNVTLLKRHHAIMAASSPRLATVSGTQSVSLPNALSMPLKSLKVEGSSTLSATPSPSSSVTITTNYGPLVSEKYELPAEYQYIDGITFSGRTYYEISNLYLTGADTVHLSFSFNTNCNVFGCYDNDSSGDRYSLYVSSSSGAKYMRYGSDAYNSYFPQSARGDRFDVTITPTGVSGLYTDSTWEEETFTSSVSMCIGLTGPGVTSTKFSGNMYGCFVVEGRFKGLPCIRKSNNDIGYYDTYSKQFYAPIGSNPSALEVSHSTITFENNTIEAAELFAIGNYKDEQDIINGSIVRCLGVKVLDGTENWTDIDQYGRTSIQLLSMKNSTNGPRTIPGYCNYFENLHNGESITDVTVGQFYLAAPQRIYFHIQQEDVATFKEWLAERYNASAPVVVIYPLATETIQEITPVALQTTLNATNTITTTNNIVVQYWKKPF